MEKLRVKKLKENAFLPTYGSEFAAGADLYACLDEKVIINPGETKIIPTGIAMEVPLYHAGLIYARSGLGIKQGLAPANCVGVIDTDYRGEWMVGLYNHSDEPRVIEHGDRIAQTVITPFLKVEYVEADELTDTARGTRGLGSTGIKE